MMIKSIIIIPIFIYNTFNILFTITEKKSIKSKLLQKLNTATVLTGKSKNT